MDEETKHSILRGTTVLLAGRRDVQEFMSTRCSLNERCQLGTTTLSIERPPGLMVRKGWPHLRSLNVVLVLNLIALSVNNYSDLHYCWTSCSRILKSKESGILQTLSGRYYPRDEAVCKKRGDYKPIPVTCILTAVYLFLTGIAISTSCVIFEVWKHSTEFTLPSVS